MKISGRYGIFSILNTIFFSSVLCIHRLLKNVMFLQAAPWNHLVTTPPNRKGTQRIVFMVCHPLVCTSVPQSNILSVILSKAPPPNIFSSIFCVLSRAHFIANSKAIKCPDWCSSVDWAWTVNQRVASSVPSQGTCLGCRGHVRGNHTLVFLSLSFSLLFSLFKNK